MANGYSSSERRANVRKQLRDRKGRWIEMGLKVRFSLNSEYAVGKVTGIDTENDEVSVETPDGTTHTLGSKELESIGAKATIPAQGEAESSAEGSLTRADILRNPLDHGAEEILGKPSNHVNMPAHLVEPGDRILARWSDNAASERANREQEVLAVETDATGSTTITTRGQLGRTLTHEFGKKDTVKLNRLHASSEESESKSDSREEENTQDKDKKLTREEIDEQLLDLELEEDVIREEGGNKDRAREIQKERLELQKKRADLNASEREEKDRDREGERSSSSSEKSREGGDKSPGGLGGPEAPSSGDSKSDKDRATESGAPGDGNDESSREKPSGGFPDVPGDGDDEHSAPSTPNAGLPNLPDHGDDEASVPQESIDILDIDTLEDGDTVILVDPVNGPEDVTEFRREEGIWTGSNDLEDLELDPDALKDYIESRDPRDLLIEHPQSSAQASSDTPVGTRVAFTLGGADGTGRITAVDAATDTAEVSIAEGTVELPLESLTVSSRGTEDGPADVYTPPAVPFSQQIPDSGRTDSGPLTADEQFAYNEARARLSTLLARENRPEVAEEVADLETFIDPLHERALEEFSGTLENVDSTVGSEVFPVTDAPTVSSPINGATDLSSRAAELYGPDEASISSINADLRAGYADDDVLALQDVVFNSEITDNVSLFRGEYVPIEVAAQIVPGRALRNDSFMTPMKSAAAVDEYLERVSDPESLIGKVPVSFRIEAEAGAPGLDLSAQSGHAGQVLFPAGVELVVTDVGWDENQEKLNVVASYDGTSVSSVADLTALEENPLKNSDTTLEDLQNALVQTNSEVNKHQFTLAAAHLSGEEEDTAEDERKLIRARSVRDSVAALIALRATEPETARAEKITDGTAAAELAQKITGSTEDETTMRAALESVASVPGSTAFVAQRNGEVAAAAATVDSREAGAADYVLVGYLGAQDDEAEAEVLDAILEDAVSRNRGVLIEPSEEDRSYWIQEQAFVEDPFELGSTAVGLVPTAITQRLSSGRPDAEPVPAHSSGLSIPTGAEEETSTALDPGAEVQDVQDLTELPEQAWVGLSSATGPTELYQKDADGAWVSATSTEDDPALTDQELFSLSSGPDTTIWFEEVSAETPEIESTPTQADAPLVEGDSVTTSDGEVTGTIERIEEGGEYIHVRDSAGVTHRFPAGFLTSPNPTPNPMPNPTPGTGEGVGTPNVSELPQRDASGQPFTFDGSGLELYVGFEVMDSQDPKYFGKITSIEEDGDYVNILGEDGTERRRKAEDLDLAVSIEMELEE